MGDHVLMRDIEFDRYLVTSITLYDDMYEDGYTESYGTVAYDQNEAFALLEKLSGEENIGTSVGQIIEKGGKAVAGGLTGPKRLEIIARIKASHRNIHTFGNRKVIVTSVVPPAGHYKTHTISGREWLSGREHLGKGLCTLYSSSYNLMRIDSYPGQGAGSSSDHFTTLNQEDAWESLERLFGEFKTEDLQKIRGWNAELQKIRDWNADAAGKEWEDEMAPYGGSQSLGSGSQNRVGGQDFKGTHTPQEAHFRVAGDEVGIAIHQEQEKAWKEGGETSPKESLKKLLELKTEKKETAGSTAPNRTHLGVVTVCCKKCGGTQCHPTLCLKGFGTQATGETSSSGHTYVH